MYHARCRVITATLCFGVGLFTLQLNNSFVENIAERLGFWCSAKINF